ncbi:MFS transporter [Alicyclobacillus sp. ALC3]|uniref:MFS transporter n=1 Tax=Alicyclobacillus sp. ALC3 TaxID=2796143 RepID=UPI002379623C|nr:MFS transporter [Alicyclobacillus sp. ALC3]WDL96730.1 MFS transporter [Alicyclobacillus sp. ALC3]
MDEVSTSPSKKSHTLLWKHADFMKLWLGQTISEFGSQITGLALSLTAVIVLHATANDMGVLEALQGIPFLFALFAGVLADRVRRRPLLIFADSGRFVLLILIPLAVLFHVLNMGFLFVVVFGVGCLTVLFDVAYQSYLPSVVSSSELVEGNSKLESTRAVSAIAGPALAGVLVQWLTAPFALLIDAGSYLVSVISIIVIRRSESIETLPHQLGIWTQIREGMAFVVKNSFLRSIVITTALGNFFSGITGAVMILFAVRGIGMNASLLGVVYALDAIGAAVGAIMGGRLGRSVGLGRAIIIAQTSSTIGGFLLPLAHRPVVVGFSLYVASGVLISFGAVAYNVNQVSARQAITPAQLLGRMTASIRFIIWGIIPFGSLLGGILGSHIGLRPTLMISAAGGVLPVLWAVLSPIRAMRSVSEIG